VRGGRLGGERGRESERARERESVRVGGGCKGVVRFGAGRGGARRGGGEERIAKKIVDGVGREREKERDRIKNPGSRRHLLLQRCLHSIRQTGYLLRKFFTIRLIFVS
jgi:hypothetical protein